MADMVLIKSTIKMTDDTPEGDNEYYRSDNRPLENDETFSPGLLFVRCDAIQSRVVREIRRHGPC